MKTSKWIAAAIVVSAGLLALGAVMTWGHADARAMVREFGLWLALPLAPLLTAWLTRDSDGDGVPDIIDDDDTPGAGGAALLVLVLALSAATQGCGTTAAQHRTLTTLTDIADPTYELALVGCDEARDFIVARQGSTETEDVADMAAINDSCDTIVDGFEALRGTQLTAREWLDEGIEGGASELVRQGIEQWQHLRALVERFQRITAGGES